VARSFEISSDRGRGAAPARGVTRSRGESGLSALSALLKPQGRLPPGARGKHEGRTLRKARASLAQLKASCRRRAAVFVDEKRNGRGPARPEPCKFQGPDSDPETDAYDSSALCRRSRRGANEIPVEISSRSKYFTSERSERSTHLCIDQRHFKPRRTRRGRAAFSSRNRLNRRRTGVCFQSFPRASVSFTFPFLFSFIYLTEKRQ